MLFVVAVGVFNFAIAHYRAALSDYGQSAATAAQRALATLTESPTGLTDLLDWFLIIAGIAFCFFATWDWFKMDDPYPGYGDMDRLAKQGRRKTMRRKWASSTTRRDESGMKRCG